MSAKKSTTDETPVQQPSLTALDLANLAVQLYPDLCKNDSEAAFREAFALWNLATGFLNENKQRDLISLYLDGDTPSGTPLPITEIAVSKALAAYGEAHAEKAEAEKLRLYPKAKEGTDEVRNYLGVKTERAVRDKFKRWFDAGAHNYWSGSLSKTGPKAKWILSKMGPAALQRWSTGGAKDYNKEENLSDFEEFWEDAKGEDEHGKSYRAFGKHTLEAVKSWEREVKRRGGLKAIQKTGANTL